MASPPESIKTSMSCATLLVLLALGYCVVAFYPYQLTWPEYARNGARWLPDGSLRFETPGVALEKGEPFPTRDLKPGESVQVVVEASSFAAKQTGPARIASFSWNSELRNLTIGQERSDLVVRVRRLHSDLNGQPSLVVPGVFAAPGWHKIETNVLPDSVEVKVDGSTRVVTSNSPQSIASWDCTYPWVFGNERTGDRPWQGEIRRAEICVDGEAVDVLRADRLSVPDRYWIRAWSTLVNPRELVSSTPTDMLVNLLGLIPFGVLLAWLRSPVMSATTAVIFAAMFSLSLEMGQILFQSRYTSLIDVLCNVGGAFMGYTAARKIADLKSDGRPRMERPVASRSNAAH